MISLPITTNTIAKQSMTQVSSIIPDLIISDRMNNNTEENLSQIYMNESSKQRIIIALAVLCVALVVLLGFFISIILCQWLQHDKNEKNLEDETNQRRTNLISSSHRQHNQFYPHTIQL